MFLPTSKVQFFLGGKYNFKKAALDLPRSCFRLINWTYPFPWPGAPKSYVTATNLGIPSLSTAPSPTRCRRPENHMRVLELLKCCETKRAMKIRFKHARSYLAKEDPHKMTEVKVEKQIDSAALAFTWAALSECTAKKRSPCFVITP